VILQGHGMPRAYRFEIKFLPLSPRCLLRDEILYRVKRCRRIQKPLGPEMRFEVRHQRIAFGLIRTLNRHTALVIRSRGRRRAKFRACQSA
jgi:hypothetical protein